MLLTPSLNLTCGAGAVNDKDLAVSFDQGNTRLFVHPNMGIIWKQSDELCRLQIYQVLKLRLSCPVHRCAGALPGIFSRCKHNNNNKKLLTVIK